jgi:mRNA interferase MazF
VVARGQVRWLLLDKPRPVVLLNRAAVIERLDHLLVAPCTATVRKLPTEVALDEADGMPKPCVVSADNVMLVDRDALGSTLTSLSEEKMQAICRALAVAVGCEQ